MGFSFPTAVGCGVAAADTAAPGCGVAAVGCGAAVDAASFISKAACSVVALLFLRCCKKKLKEKISIFSFLLCLLQLEIQPEVIPHCLED